MRYPVWIILWLPRSGSLFFQMRGDPPRKAGAKRPGRSGLDGPGSMVRGLADLDAQERERLQVVACGAYQARCLGAYHSAMKRSIPRKILIFTGCAVFGGAGLFLAGCMRVSNGTWIVNEAPLPEGWPKLTPVGQVEVKQYPAYRAAFIESVPTPDAAHDQATDTMFNQLFSHIKANDIPMTAPVEMGYADASVAEGTQPAMDSMAFLYRYPGTGTPEDDGDVAVRDMPGQTVVSIGVRGGYTPEQYADALARLDTWFDQHPEYTRAGPPRTLGYNSPFVPAFFRYGEVQLPVTTTE